MGYAVNIKWMPPKNAWEAILYVVFRLLLAAFLAVLLFVFLGPIVIGPVTESVAMRTYCFWIFGFLLVGFVVSLLLPVSVMNLLQRLLKCLVVIYPARTVGRK